jgi:hypothetical protein
VVRAFRSRNRPRSHRVLSGRVIWRQCTAYGVARLRAYGRRARQRVIETIRFFVDDSRTALLVDDVKLPRGAHRRSVDRLTSTRQNAAKKDLVLGMREHEEE